jgi:hypothetical protein
MRTRRCIPCLLACLTVALPLPVHGQEAQVSAGGAFLLSLQPVDDSYVGGPYLNEGIGGIGPGMALTFNVITPKGFIVAAEFSTAWFELRQNGRLVPAPCPPSVPSNECNFIGGSGTTRLRDPLLGAFVGVAKGRQNTHVHLLAGVSWLVTQPTINGIAIRGHGLNDGRNDRPIAFGGGFDVVQDLKGRASIAVGARYGLTVRDESLRFLGIGPHILRVGAGLRIRLQ